MNPNDYYNKTAKTLVMVGSMMFGFSLGYLIVNTTFDLINGATIDTTMVLFVLGITLFGALLMVLGYLKEKRS